MFEKACRTLRIDPDAPPEAVRKAFVKMVRRYPPEHFGRKFAEFQKARDELTLTRERVDALLEQYFEADTVEEFLKLWFGDLLDDVGQTMSAEVEQLDLTYLVALMEKDNHKELLDETVKAIGEKGIEFQR